MGDRCVRVLGMSRISIWFNHDHEHVCVCIYIYINMSKYSQINNNITLYFNGQFATDRCNVMLSLQIQFQRASYFWLMRYLLWCQTVRAGPSSLRYTIYSRQIGTSFHTCWSNYRDILATPWWKLAVQQFSEDEVRRFELYTTFDAPDPHQIVSCTCSWCPWRSVFLVTMNCPRYQLRSSVNSLGNQYTRCGSSWIGAQFQFDVSFCVKSQTYGIDQLPSWLVSRPQISQVWIAWIDNSRFLKLD